MALQNKKSLGQNWLKDRDTLIDIADIASTDGVSEVLEIGPGLGTSDVSVSIMDTVRIEPSGKVCRSGEYSLLHHITNHPEILTRRT